MQRPNSPFFSWSVLPALLLYNLLSPLLVLAMLPGWLRRARARGHWAEAWPERLGWPEKELRDWARTAQPVWIHAVSVGECGVAIKLLRAWLADRPQASGQKLEENFVLTTTTATGRRLLEKFLQSLPEEQRARLRICWAPLDLLPCAWLTLRSFAPRMLLLTEAEWWPNWLSLCSALGVPSAIFNARLSPRSAGRLRKFRWLVGPLLRQLSWVGVQREAERESWTQLGLEASCVQHTGSVKYELGGLSSEKPAAEFARLLEQVREGSSAPVLMGVSTFAGEERLLAEVAKGLGAQGQPVQLVIVPRHAERAGEIRAELEELGWQVRLRHPLAQVPQESRIAEEDKAQRVLLINSTGELRQWLRLADVAVIGKSWRQGVAGGQNPVEALEAGVLPICGPEMSNFASLVEELQLAGALEQVQGEVEELPAKLVEKLRQVLPLAEQRAEAVQRGLELLKGHQGAALRTLEALEKMRK